MIVGITGALGAGTDTLGEFFVGKGFFWFSYSDVLRDEARKRGIELTRKNLQDLGDELRMNEGFGVLSKRLMEKMEEGKNYVVGNIRNPGEVEVFREEFGQNFILIMIDAPQKIRFERIKARGREKDAQSFEEFLEVEERDLGIGQEEHGQQHGKVFEMADKKIINDLGIDEFKERFEEVFREMRC